MDADHARDQAVETTVVRSPSTPVYPTGTPCGVDGR